MLAQCNPYLPEYLPESRTRGLAPEDRNKFAREAPRFGANDPSVESRRHLSASVAREAQEGLRDESTPVRQAVAVRTVGTRSFRTQGSVGKGRSVSCYCLDSTLCSA